VRQQCHVPQSSACGLSWHQRRVRLTPGALVHRRLAAELLASEAYPTTGEKENAFVQQGGDCRAMF